jgi:hypothetical protein
VEGVFDYLVSMFSLTTNEEEHYSCKKVTATITWAAGIVGDPNLAGHI